MLHEPAEFTGTVHQGVIVVDGGVELGEGQTVKIIASPSAVVVKDALPVAPTANGREGESKLSPLAQMLLSHAGTIDDWPPDFALNHDQNLYGAEKRADEQV